MRCLLVTDEMSNFGQTGVIIMATRYFYSINRDNIQQIDDTYSAYALDRIESINNYFAGISYCYRDTYFPLTLDDTVLCSDNSGRNRRYVYWLTYIIPKYNDELIYVHNPDPDNPVYMLRGAPTSNIVYAYGCWIVAAKDGNGNATAWQVRDYQIKDMIVDINVPSKATADIIYIFGGNATYYNHQITTDDVAQSVAARKAIANKLKILRYRPIKDIKDKLHPFGLAIYNAKGELIYTVDADGKNYKMDEYYQSKQMIAGTYYTGKTPELEYYEPRTYDNVAVMAVNHPYVTEGFGIKGHPGGVDPSRLYPVKLTQHQWSISQLSGCGAERPTEETWDHPDSMWHEIIYDDYVTQPSSARTTSYYYYQDNIDGGYGMLSSGYAEVMAMDCSRYLTT